MNREDIELLVLSVLATVLKIDVDREASTENTPQWDSLKHIEIIFAIEDELDLQFPEDKLSGLDSVDAILDEIESCYAS